MAGLTAGAPTPQSITLHAKSRVLEVVFSDGAQFRIPFELMRVYSPSAEVAGHGPGQEVLQTGQREVTITNLASIGNYAIQPQFSDGHESGIFSWDLLYELGQNQQALWDDYAATMQAAVADWLAAHPDHPDSAGIAERAHQLDLMFQFGHGVLGFGLYLLRKPD